MFTIARFTFLEAVRNRLFVLVMVGVVCAFGLAEFIGELAITETKQIQGALLSSLLRIFSISIIGLFVVTSVTRELNDKGLEMIMSLPVPRHRYLFGKLCGYAGLALLVSFIICLPLIIYAPLGRVAYWFFSLLCEQLIVVALSLVCLFTFSNVTVSFTAVMAFYLLSRSMQAIQLLSESPVLEFNTLSQDFMNRLLDGIALILPDLSAFTRSDWLVYPVSLSDMRSVVIQTLIYMTILVSAGLFDLYRKDL